MDDLESSRSFAQYCCELSRESRWLKVALRTHEVACAICCGFTILPPSLALRAMSGETSHPKQSEFVPISSVFLSFRGAPQKTMVIRALKNQPRRINRY